MTGVRPEKSDGVSLLVRRISRNYPQQQKKRRMHLKIDIQEEERIYMSSCMFIIRFGLLVVGTIFKYTFIGLNINQM